MILEEIKSAFSENKLAIIASVAILFSTIILGYYLEPDLYSYLNPVVEDLSQKVETGVIQLTFADIFSNNFKIILQMFVYGLVFCFSAFILGFNGFFVGYYVATADDLFSVLMFIVPHGIFEFSSCILACAAGFVLFNFIWRFFRALSKQDSPSMVVRLSNATDSSFDKFKQALILFFIAVILMVIAGIIEVYLTIPIAEFVFYLLG